MIGGATCIENTCPTGLKNLGDWRSADRVRQENVARRIRKGERAVADGRPLVLPGDGHALGLCNRLSCTDHPL